MRKAALILAVVLTVVLYGCDLPTSDRGDDGAGRVPEGLGGGIEEAPEGSTLFEADESNASKIVFKTNDGAYKRSGGYTFWQKRGEQDIKTSSLSIKLAKASGGNAGGYGFFFNEGLVAGAGKCMITVLIRKDGYFAVGKVIGTAYRNISWWQHSPYLNTGYGVGNRLTVAWDGGKGEYVLSAGEQELKRFKDEAPPECTGNGIGYIAVLTGEEQFPSVAVEVWYERVRE